MMYKWLKYAVLILSVLVIEQQANAITTSKNYKEKNSRFSGKSKNRRLLVRYKENAKFKNMREAHYSVGAYVVKTFDFPRNLQLVEVVRGISLEAAQEIYNENPDVLYAEPNYRLHLLQTPPPSPNEPPIVDPPPSDGAIDPQYSKQWHLNNEGQNEGTLDADINGPELWANFEGDKNVVVAVIDTGVDYTHNDLKNSMFVNPGEIPGNGIDDDNNGFIDDVHGINAITKTGDPMDDHRHGTHVAGIIGAEGQNSYGGRGVMQKASIVACKFLDAHGGGDTSDAITCLNYLLNLKTRSTNPINVVASNNSWGGGGFSQAMYDAIKTHQDAGILFVAAASNDSADNDQMEAYPANYDLVNIISVASTDRHDKLSWFSNYGKRKVHVGSPGEEILSTIPGNGYENMDGTSMATPNVVGLVGMIAGYLPGLSYTQIKNLVVAGGTPLADLDGKILSGRRIRAWDVNGQGSLTCKDQIVSGRLSPSADNLTVTVGAKILLSAININCSEPNGPAIILPVEKVGAKGIRLEDTGSGADGSANDGTFTAEWTATEPGHYEFVFPNNDVVSIDVYDPQSWQDYEYHRVDNFQYRHIEGTKLDSGDDYDFIIKAPFPIQFAADAYGLKTLNVTSNGALSLTSSSSISFENRALPDEEYSSFVAPFWDDLNPGKTEDGAIYYDTLGTAPNREFVVEWRNVAHYSSQEGVTFQVVFFENSPNILFNYLDVDFGNVGHDKGASASVGIQISQNRAIQVGYNQAVLENNMGLLFTPKPISAEPIAPPSDDPIGDEPAPVLDPISEPIAEPIDEPVPEPIEEFSME